MQDRRVAWVAHAYVYSVILAGLFSLGWSAKHFSPDQWKSQAVFVLLVGVASLVPVVVKLKQFFIVTTGLVQAAMLIWGPAAGILSAAVGGIAASFNKPDDKSVASISLYKMAFNVAAFSLAAYLAACVFRVGAATWNRGEWWGALLLYVAAPAVLNLSNTVLVALAIHLHGGVPLLMVLRNAGWTVPYWIALWAIGAVMAFNYRSTGFFGIVVFMLPLFLVRYGFQLYVAKSKEAEAYVNDLRLGSEKLAHTVQLLSVLQRGSVMLTSNLDPSLVPGRVRDLAVEALSYPHGALFGQDRDHFRCLGAWYGDGEVEPNVDPHLEASARRVVGKRLQHLTLAGEHWCLLPLIMNGSPIGVMCLGGDPNKLKENEGVLETFSAQVAAALATSRLHDETRRMALTDGLTGLANQRSMREQLGRLMDLALEQGTPLSLVTLDLDKFKQINDRFGHPTGDRAIREVANIIQARLGPGDVAARNGGDEFAVILPGKQVEEARTFMQELAEAVARSELMHGKQRIPLTLSVGIATFPEHANTLPALISRSDQAVYISKHTGRNRVTVWGDLSGVEDQLGQHWSWTLDDSKRDSHSTTADPVKVMTAMVDARDGLTYGHSVRVQKYCAAVARLMGLSEAAVASISLGGLLHDVGKIGIPDAILNKPGPLTKAETEMVQQHPEIGAELMRRIGMPEELVAMVLHHHEWYNGQGYPSGLNGREIPLGARILSVCDAFEAITSRRPYKQPKPIPWAVEELRRCAGTQFDPEIVETFVTGVLGQGASEQTAAALASGGTAHIQGGGGI